jgi:hypothetical protein
MISGRCTKCKKWFRVPDGTAGWIGECRGCGNKFHIPTIEQYKSMVREKILAARMQGLDGIAAVSLATSRFAQQETNPDLDTHYGDEMKVDSKTQTMIDFDIAAAGFAEIDKLASKKNGHGNIDSHAPLVVTPTQMRPKRHHTIAWGAYALILGLTGLLIGLAVVVSQFMQQIAAYSGT